MVIDYKIIELRLIKTILILFFLLFSLCSNSQPKIVDFNTIYVDADLDTMPSFYGGQDDLFLFIHDNFHTNFKMKKEMGNYSGSFVVNFIVDSLGHISNISFLTSFSTSVDQEIIKILNKMPEWKPGFLKGKPVSVMVYLPITFTIDEGDFRVVHSNNTLISGHSKDNKILKIVIMAITVFSMFILFRHS